MCTGKSILRLFLFGFVVCFFGNSAMVKSVLTNGTEDVFPGSLRYKAFQFPWTKEGTLLFATKEQVDAERKKLKDVEERLTFNKKYGELVTDAINTIRRTGPMSKTFELEALALERESDSILSCGEPKPDDYELFSDRYKVLLEQSLQRHAKIGLRMMRKEAQGVLWPVDDEVSDSDCSDYTASSPSVPSLPSSASTSPLPSSLSSSSIGSGESLVSIHSFDSSDSDLLGAMFRTAIAE